MFLGHFRLARSEDIQSQKRLDSHLEWRGVDGGRSERRTYNSVFGHSPSGTSSNSNCGDVRGRFHASPARITRNLAYQSPYRLGGAGVVAGRVTLRLGGQGRSELDIPLGNASGKCEIQKIHRERGGGGGARAFVSRVAGQANRKYAVA